MLHFFLGTNRQDDWIYRSSERNIIFDAKLSMNKSKYENKTYPILVFATKAVMAGLYFEINDPF